MKATCYFRTKALKRIIKQGRLCFGLGAWLRLGTSGWQQGGPNLQLGQLPRGDPRIPLDADAEPTRSKLSLATTLGLAWLPFSAPETADRKADDHHSDPRGVAQGGADKELTKAWESMI